MMEATIRKDDDSRVTLILDGRLDTSVTQQTQKDIEPLFNYKHCEIVIDCSRLEYISSSGLRMMMVINQRCRANHCDIFIKGLQEKVLDVFNTTGFVHLFKFC
jgi:anti-anti-sigma factor